MTRSLFWVPMWKVLCPDITDSWFAGIRCCKEVTSTSAKMMFDGSIENISCITQHVDYDAITNRAVLLQVAPLLRNKDGGTYRRWGGVSENEWVQNLSECYPGPRSFLWLSFFYLEFCDAKLRANKKNKRSGSRRKICQIRIKESLWDQGIRMYVKRENKKKIAAEWSTQV